MEKTSISRNTSHIKIAYLVKVAVLSALAFIVMLFEFPMPFAPAFYQLDLSETIVLIGGFAMGPVAGVIIEFIKVFLHFLVRGSATQGVGELANFLIGCSMVIPAAFIYKHKKTLKSAIIGMGVGAVIMTAIGAAVNYFIVLPAYSIMVMPLDAIIQMGTEANGAIDSLFTLVMFSTVPFNLLKGIICSVLTALLYKRVSPILHKQF